MAKVRALITVGLLLVGTSLGLWVFAQAADQAGDASAFEQRPTPTAPAIAATVPTSTSAAPAIERQAAVAPRAGPAATPLRFTVGESVRAHGRTPVALRIPAIDLNTRIVLAGVEPNGDMEVPGNITDVGWYRYGPSPGQAGSAVLAAHVDLAGQGPGAFYDLRTIESGDIIEVIFDDGSSESYRAEARTMYKKNDLPMDAIFSRDGPPVLTLITCGGGFNSSVRSYDSNVVVYAVPIATPVDPT